ncbi:hypothetical protein ES703_105814 [subsurface metagenome]
MTDQLFSRNATNHTYYIIRFFMLFLSFNKNIPKIMYEELDRLSSKFGNNPDVDWDLMGSIFSNEDYRKMLFYLIDYGVATPFILEKRLGVSTTKVYRFLKEMRMQDVIQLAMLMPTARSSTGGPRPMVLRTEDATQDQINDAVRLHRNLTSPKYRYAEEMAQLMLDDYILVKDMTEISRSEYIEFLRERKVNPSMIPDIVINSISYFKEQGIRLHALFIFIA